MAEEDARPPILFYLVSGVALLAVLAVGGAALYQNWGRLGLPSISQFKEELEASRTGEVKGAVTVEGTPQNYDRYVSRDDVMVLVNYYASDDQRMDGVLDYLKKLSGKHDGKVVIMNVNVLAQGKMAVDAGVLATPDFRLMQGGELIEQVSGIGDLDRLEKLVAQNKGQLSQATLQAAELVDPYAESVKAIRGDFVPEGVSPQ